jgi:subtilisin-like proprotein convertase family protein
VSLAGFTLVSDPPGSQTYALSDFASTIGGLETLELQSGASASGNISQGIYVLTNQSIYRNGDTADFARLVRPNSSTSQMNCTAIQTEPPETPTPVSTFFPNPTKDCINGEPGVLPDNGGANYIYYTFSVTETRTLLDMDICVNVDHTRVGDLTIALKHGEGGAQVILLDRPGYSGSGFGCTGDNIRILFDDDAPTFAENVCNGSPPAINGTYKPVEPLSFFNGESMEGDWFLEIYDVQTGETGTTRGGYMWWTVAN